MTSVISRRSACLGALFLFLSLPGSAWTQEPSTSSCISCHTDVKKLIRLGWEVEKVRGQPAVSAETEGEG